MTSSSEDVVLTLFLVGLLFAAATGGTVTYVLITRGHHATRATVLGSVTGVTVAVLSTVMTVGLPLLAAIFGLTILPATTAFWAVGWLRFREVLRKGPPTE